MLELVTTRDNPMIDPAMHVWGWEIPVYLFLGGWVAGSMVLAGCFMRQGRRPGRRLRVLRAARTSLLLLSLGMGALFLDLEHRLYVWRMYPTLQPASPMSWGAWILLLVYPVLALSVLVSIPGDWLERWPAVEAPRPATARGDCHPHARPRDHRARRRARHLHRRPALSLGARPLWNSAALGPLFLVSGLSTAAAFAHLVARSPATRGAAARGQRVPGRSSSCMIGLFLIGLSTAAPCTPTRRAGARRSVHRRVLGLRGRPRHRRCRCSSRCSRSRTGFSTRRSRRSS